MPRIDTNECDNLLYNILHYTSDAVIIVSLNEMGIPDSIMHISDTALELFRNSLRNMLDSDLSNHIDENAFRELTMMQEKETTHIPFNIIDRDGRSIPLHAHVSHVVYRNQNALLIIARDTRERQQLENKLSQIEKLEAVGQLAGGIAHDFNNVLAGISGLAELTLRKLPEDHKAVSSVKTIYQKANNTAHMVQQLVAFSRKQSLTSKATDINKIIRNNQKLLERYLGEDIRFILDLQNGLHIIKIDPSALDQIITNMCINARDAMPDGGTLTIKTRNKTTYEEKLTSSGIMPPGQYVHLTIEDNGMGMDEKTLQHIFEPFYTTKDVGYGTGLGLSIVYGLLKQHNSFIECRSAIGEGTIFEMFFPVHKVTESARATNKNEINLNGSESILLVEDEADLILFLKESLELYGYTVYIAHNGAKALEVFELHKEEIDLVISDVVMPEIGGIELKLILEKMKPTLHFLLISAYTNRLEPGVPFLQKPFQSREMLEVVRSILDGTYIIPEK